MSRNGSGVYSLPAGSTITNGDTSDATDLNTPLTDLETDMNTARPVVAGGTGATSASAARTNLGLVIGADVQAEDATLTSIAALGTAANKGTYTTGVDTWAEFDLTSAGRALLDDADAEAQRTTLGLGSLATLSEVDTAQLADDAVETDQIADGQVTEAKLASAVTAKFASVTAKIDMSAQTIDGGSGVSSVNRTATGVIDITWTTAFSDADYIVILSVEAGANNTAHTAKITAQSTTGITVRTLADNTQFNSTGLHVLAYA